MSPEQLIEELFTYLPCPKNYGLSPTLRKDGKWVLKIGVIVDSGGRKANAATIWSAGYDKVNVIIYQGGPQHIDWPEMDCSTIAQKICEFCESKSREFSGAECIHKLDEGEQLR